MQARPAKRLRAKSAAESSDGGRRDGHRSVCKMVCRTSANLRLSLFVSSCHFARALDMMMIVAEIEKFFARESWLKLGGGFSNLPCSAGGA